MKKPPTGKRAKPPRRVDYSRRFLKDWKRLSRSGRYDMHRLKAAMLLLIANDAPLGPEWRDHALKGSWARRYAGPNCSIEGRRTAEPTGSGPLVVGAPRARPGSAGLAVAIAVAQNIVVATTSPHRVAVGIARKQPARQSGNAAA